MTSKLPKLPVFKLFAQHTRYDARVLPPQQCEANDGWACDLRDGRVFQQMRSTGSCWILDLNSMLSGGEGTDDPNVLNLVTCAHCVERLLTKREMYDPRTDLESLCVEIPLHDNAMLTDVRLYASVKYVCPELDFAILKVRVPERYDRTNLKSVEIEFDVDRLDRDERGLTNVQAVGYPGGRQYTTTPGSISVLHVEDGISIGHTAPINPGNSGGPLVHNGKVIGINAAGRMGEQGSFYATKMRLVRDALKSHIHRGLSNEIVVRLPFLGLCYRVASDTNTTRTKIDYVFVENRRLRELFDTHGKNLQLIGVRTNGDTAYLSINAKGMVTKDKNDAGVAFKNFIKNATTRSVDIRLNDGTKTLEIKNIELRSDFRTPLRYKNVHPFEKALDQIYVVFKDNDGRILYHVLVRELDNSLRSFGLLQNVPRPRIDRPGVPILTAVMPAMHIVEPLLFAYDVLDTLQIDGETPVLLDVRAMRDILDTLVRSRGTRTLKIKKLFTNDNSRDEVEFKIRSVERHDTCVFMIHIL